MTVNPDQLEMSFAFNPEPVTRLKESWSGIMVQMVWGERLESLSTDSGEEGD